MKTGMVVVNYNDFQTTEKYIKLVSAYSCLNKIVVVDNCSTNIEKGAYDTLLSDKVDVIFSDKNAGYASGNNLGIHYLNNTYGDFDYIIISNADIFIEEKSIEACLDVLKKNKEFAVAAPRMYYSETVPANKSSWKSRKVTDDLIVLSKALKLLFYSKFKGNYYSESDFANDILEVDCIAGSFFVAKNSAFREAGYFDEHTFLYYEEDILGRRLWQKGYKTVSLNREKFLHFESQTIDKVFRRMKKQKLIFDSMLYYQKQYNQANKSVICLFYMLYYLQKIELFIVSLFKEKGRNV